MSMPNLAITACVLALAFGAGAATADSPRLGKPIGQGDIAEWDINILPDGSNLPPGGGSAAEARHTGTYAWDNAARDREHVPSLAVRRAGQR